MTVMVAERAAAGGAGGGAAGGSTRAKARQRRPTDTEMGRGGQAGGGTRRGQQGSRGPRGATGQAAPAPAPEQREKPQKRERSQSRRREAARRVTGAATKPEPALHNYQAIIAAEFVGAVLLAAIGPFSSNTPGPTQQSPTSISPYGASDIVKIFAIGITYLILEFLAAGPRGLARFSAWFGALIFLAVGLSELSRLGQIFKTLSGGNVSPVKLTAAQAPAVKGSAVIPPLGQPGAAAAAGGGGPAAAASGRRPMTGGTGSFVGGT